MLDGEGAASTNRVSPRGVGSFSAPGGPHGVLVLHGYTSTTESMAGIAQAFAARGWAVEAPLLPGHGTTVDDLATRTWRDWADAVDAVYRGLADRVEKVVVIGHSVGGSLALWLGMEHPGLAGVVCINAPVEVPAALAEITAAMLAQGIDRIDSIGGGVADPRATERGYDATPLRPLVSLAEAADELRPRLAEVHCPVYVIASREDHVVDPSNSDVIAAAVSGPVERLWLERSYHVATVDFDAELLVEECLAFASRITGA